MRETDHLGDSLAGAATRSPLVLGAAWIAFLCAISLLSYAAGDPETLKIQTIDTEAKIDWLAAAITALAATIATFRIHAYGRTPLWRAVPLLIFAAWQVFAIYTTRDIPIEKPVENILYGHSPECFLFILSASIPLGIGLFWLLRRINKQLGPSVSPMAGLSVSSTAVWLLDFFHPFQMNFGDWSIHFLAMGIVVGASAYMRWVLPNA